MGDTPFRCLYVERRWSIPSKDSWGVHLFVHGIGTGTYSTMPSTADQVETYSIVNIIYYMGTSVALDAKATLVIGGQEFQVVRTKQAIGILCIARRNLEVGVRDSQYGGKTGWAEGVLLPICHQQTSRFRAKI